MEGIRELSELIRREAELFAEFERSQEALLDAIRERAWAELETQLQALSSIQLEIQNADAERQRLFGRHTGDLSTTATEAEVFEALLEAIQPGDRVDLEQAYHALKIGVVKAQGSLVRLDHYIASVTSTLESLLGELMPHRKGRIYSNTGAETGTRDKALVVDQTL